MTLLAPDGLFYACDYVDLFAGPGGWDAAARALGLDGVGIELDPDVPAEMQRGLELFGQFDQDAGIRDIEATIRKARACRRATAKAISRVM